jgi:hypothetical protein
LADVTCDEADGALLSNARIARRKVRLK